MKYPQLDSGGKQKQPRTENLDSGWKKRTKLIRAGGMLHKSPGIGKNTLFWFHFKIRTQTLQRDPQQKVATCPTWPCISSIKFATQVFKDNKQTDGQDMTGPWFII